MKRTTKKLSQLLVLALLTVMMCIGASAAGSVTGLKQTEWRDTSVSIQWDLYPGANRYAIYIGTTPDNCECDGRYSSETSDYITGLNPGSSYYVKIKAYKGWGSEAKEAEALGWSEPFQVSTLPAEPAEPANFKWLDSTATTVTLGWDPIANVSGYEVYRYISYDNEPVVADIPAGSTVAVVNQEKASSASYFVRAYVTGQNGTRVYSSSSSSASASTVPGRILTSQFGITYVWNGLKRVEFGVAQTPANADGVQIVATTMKGNKKVMDSLKSDEIAFGTIKKKGVKYRARAYVDINGVKKYGPWSTYRYFAIPNAQSKSKNKRITVTWNKIDVASKYTVYISKNSDSGYKKYGTYGKKSNSCTITKFGKKKLKGGETYYIRVVPTLKVGKKTKKSQVYTNISQYISRY